MYVRALLFDLDGTLLDSLADIADSANSVLDSLGLPTYPVDQYRYFVGDGLARLVRRLLPPDRRDDVALQRQCMDRFGEHYRSNWNNRSQLYEGVPELLEQLTRLELPMAVLSNKPQEFTSLCVEHYLADFPFVAVLGVDAQRPRKPDPTGAVEIVNRFGGDAQQWVFLGDTATDMETACRAGMYPVGALWGFRDASELRAAGARQLIDQPTDLLAVIDGIGA
jgi:phosphoglycolate phosphatase